MRGKEQTNKDAINEALKLRRANFIRRSKYYLEAIEIAISKAEDSTNLDFLDIGLSSIINLERSILEGFIDLDIISEVDLEIGYLERIKGGICEIK